jgi:hypothetical protein
VVDTGKSVVAYSSPSCKVEVADACWDMAQAAPIKVYI